MRKLLGVDNVHCLVSVWVVFNFFLDEKIRWRDLLHLIGLWVVMLIKQGLEHTGHGVRKAELVGKLIPVKGGHVGLINLLLS